MAQTSSPPDTTTTTLTLANAAPTLGAPILTPTGTVFTGSTVTLEASFGDAGANDTHTCSVLWSDSITTTGAVTEPTTTTPGSCSSSRALNTPGSYGATVTVTDDDLASDTRSTATNADIDVVDLVIEGGNGAGGSFAGVEGTAILPAVQVPAGTALSWSVSEAIPATPGTNCAVTNSTSDHPSILCNDNGEFIIEVEALLNGQTARARLPLHVENASPVLAIPTLSPTGTIFPGTTITVTGTFTDAGSNDTHTCAVDWSDGEHTTGSVAGLTCTASRVLNTVDVYTATMTVTDDDHGSDTRSTTEGANGTITVTTISIPPGDGPGGAYTALEGSPAHPTVNAPAGVTLAWSVTPVSVDGGATCSIAGGNGATPSVTCTDDGTWNLHVTASTGGYSTSADVGLVTSNVSPVVTPPTVSAALVAVGSPVTATSTYSDAGSNDSHTCTVRWGDAAFPSPGTIDAGAHTCSATKSFATANVYRITTTVTDDNGGVGTASYEYVVVYDPGAGFVTGGGTIDVRPGSYTPDPTKGGKANFGFNSKYDKNSSTPKGNTEFQLHSAGMNFKGDVMQWLLVSGNRAQYRGAGTVNGVSGYSFLVTIVDGGKTGDQFRIKVWNASGTLFDSEMGTTTALDSAPATPLTGGSIVIHDK